MAHIQITDLNSSTHELGDELTEEELLTINGGRVYVPNHYWDPSNLSTGKSEMFLNGDSDNIPA
jgi:hypothetical protein